MKRFNKKLIIWKTLSHTLFGMLMIAYFSLDVIFSEEESIYEPVHVLIAVLILIVLSLIYNTLYYKTSGYELLENKIMCKVGVIFKKTSYLEYERIHSVNKKQGFIQQMFSLATLTIDSGSTNTASIAEIKIIEDSKVVDELVNRLRNSSKEEKLEEVDLDFVYKFSKKKKFLFGLFNFLNAILYALFIFIIGCIGFFVLYTIKDLLPRILPLEIVNVIILCVFVILFLGLIILIGSLFVSFFQFYNFKIEKNNNTFNIESGLFERNTHNFNINRIKALSVKQTFSQRLFGFCSIEIDVIGVNEVESNNNRKINKLIPLCKISEVDTIINELLPEYKITKNEVTSKNYLSYICFPMLFISIFYVIGFFAFIGFSKTFNLDLWIEKLAVIIIIASYFVVLLLLMLLTKLQQKIVGFSINDNKLIINNGCLGTVVDVIDFKDIIAIERTTTKYRALKNTYSYIIHYKFDKGLNRIKIKNVYNEQLEKLMSKVIL